MALSPTAGDAESPANVPLLNSDGGDNANSRTTVLGKTLSSTADLAKHLPTGAVLAFEVLSPAFTANGSCTAAHRAVTACLIAVCASLCALLCFTDSFRDGKGIVRYGFVTRSGRLLVIDDGAAPPEDPGRYRITVLDFFHAFLSFVVFLSVAMVDRNVVSCFYPVESASTRQLLSVVPMAAGAAGSLLFARFPSTRRGIGFPVGGGAA